MIAHFAWLVDLGNFIENGIAGTQLPYQLKRYCGYPLIFGWHFSSNSRWLPALTTCPESAEAIVAKTASRVFRLLRPELNGWRSSSMAQSSSPIVPRKPSLNHSPSSLAVVTPSSVSNLISLILQTVPEVVMVPLDPVILNRSKFPCLL